ncbi:M55 family metallopeptidase, partial [Candidatus Peregrinibacteria bacterium]|nr:M55 family metallopeptidase [Candidatus Peregrinibacteria bacterium]
MKLYIKVDMEGVTGIISYTQTNPDSAEYKFGQHMFMSDLNALLSGIYYHGNHEVVIYDMHFDGRNIDLEAIDSRVKVITGKPPLTEKFCYGMEEGFDGLILMGFHSMAGNKEGLLNHSYELDTLSLSINDISVGEIGIEAALAGEMDIPVALITGDSEGIKEAERLLGEVPTVIVKESKSESIGLCYSVVETARKIKEAVPSALDRLLAKRPKPFLFSPPITLLVSLSKGSMFDAIRKQFPEKLLDK